MFKVARSANQDVALAVKDIREQLPKEAALILYFASPIYPAKEISKEMAHAFLGVHTVGCSTTGEMISEQMGEDSIVAMAWPKEALKYLQIEVLENVKTDDYVVEKAFKSFARTLGTASKSWDPTRYVGLVMIDGLSGREEALNDQIGNLTNVAFVGGSAGDNCKFEITYIYADGKAYTNAAVLVLMEPSNGFEILKTQSFSLTDKKLTPTKVNEEQRTVYEFNHRPAVEAYAEALGVTVSDLPAQFGEHPLGLVFDAQNIFVRSPQQVVGTSIVFYCSVKENMELTILQSGDIVTDTRRDIEQVKKDSGSLEAVIDFNCILRSLELKNHNQQQAYANIFKSVPAIGLVTYGESYIGHINQTSTMLLLK